MTPERLFANLFWGEDRARSIGDIAEAHGCSRRMVEKAAEQLRADGSPICSGRSGLWLSDDPVELRHQYRALRSRAIGQMVNARRLLRTARAFERQQMRLW